jgi:hypothetical protein
VEYSVDARWRRKTIEYVIDHDHIYDMICWWRIGKENCSFLDHGEIYGVFC